MSWKTMVWQVGLLLICFLHSLHGQVTYSVPEEMSKGSFVGSITQDLGLEPKRLISGKARIYTGDGTEYIGLDKEKGTLFIREKMDREVLCGKTTPCALHLQVILDNPMELYRITIEITDINDNAPVFKDNEMKFKISESAMTGAVFMLEKAVDRDVGINGLLRYSLKPTDNFDLKLNSHADGSKNVEMILQKPLDREKQERLTLLLTAKDGGEPQMSGTVQIHVTVLDVNDNAPVFTQNIYKATLTENALRGTKLLTVTATDADDGSNSVVRYYISNRIEGMADLFSIDSESGDITVDGVVDYEISSRYELDIQAKDQGGLSDSCKVIIDITDVNDNKPSISIISMSSSISEESNPGTVIAMMNVNDPDSGKNGQVKCSIEDSIPFTMTSPSNNFFTLLTHNELDREKTSEYEINIICSDEGAPPLSSNVTLKLHISDVNDNAPVFEKDSYEAFVLENNTPGLAVFSVKAKDADWNQNARVNYMLVEGSVSGVPVSSYVSVHADSGAIHAIRSFDYEQMKNIQFTIKAQDGGSPPLSSNVTVLITIQDQNDNTPQVLYPVQTSSSALAEIVPRSADIGYLVSKVVAVDVDSGQNAWLSYKLQKAGDRPLFEVGAQNGEIRTVRQVTDKDAVKQKLTVVVEDNGQPTRSATVNVNVAVADSFPEVLSEFTDITHDKSYTEDLTFYLVLALVVVSFLFIACLVAIISVKIYRWRQGRLYQSNLPVIPYYPPHYADTGSTGTLKHMYNYEVCMTTDSRKSDATYLRPTSQNVLIMDPNTNETMKRIQKEQLFLDDLSSPEQVRPLVSLNY